LAHAFLWEHSYKRLKLAQLLGQLGERLLSHLIANGPAHSAGQVLDEAANFSIPDIGSPHRA
jgi:hypothetical protein